MRIGPVRLSPTTAGLTPTAAMAKLVGVLVVPVAVIATGIGVVASSYSAFTASTSSPGSSWSTGTVALSNDAGTGTAAFTVAGIKPGFSDSRCIKVTSTGTLPSEVRLYATSATASNALSNALSLTITRGTGGAAVGDCTGFVAAGPATNYTGLLTAFAGLTGYASGVLPWSPTGTETATYKIDYSLPLGAPNTAQGLQAGVVFTWEAQNT
ncbi:hypothetical protein [Amnibacterium endophyticum]|uniref:Camelysin metallo-endopeptidase n=1 Tax=Amnibacterium endophyticum TaxID=2109337 RepID=A0ABW4LEL8_9MICO